MRGLYTVEFENVSVTAAQDLISILPATQKPLEVHGFTLDQISDIGDAMEEILRLRLVRGHTTAPSGGAAATPRPTDPNDAAAAFGARVNDTTIASAGTGINLWSGAFNIRVGREVWFPPECRIKVASAEYLNLRLLAAPTDAVTMSGTLWVEEL